MIDKVNSTNQARGVSKAKQTKRSPSAGESNFADLLTEDAAAPQNTDHIPSASGYPSATPGFVLPEDDIPSQPEAHGAYLLAQLELLAADILLGRSTTAIENLKRALAHSPLSSAELTATQREALEALHMRAAIEVEKSGSHSA